ncbi:MAG: tripartite tricarboxylate transporter substrate binding protein [Alphaproteobacteria bacterium]|nr:tripartite tricarboxylate transporter substrate binding protein [Alphaproteobacteria bacterium]
MNARFVRNTAVSFAMLAGLAVHNARAADTYPSKPVHIVVPYVAGGLVDSLARVVASHMSETMGQPVIVENRPGASAMLGMSACARATPDGYTACLTLPDPITYNPQLFKELPYDPARDFAAVINLGFTNNLLAANITEPFDTYKDMIAYAKANPGKINWGTWGPATVPDLYLRWILNRTHVDITAISYKGAAQTNPALIAGEIDVMYTGFGVARPQIDAHQVKPIVSVTAKRSRFIPDLPTLAEAGDDPGLQSYFGVWTTGGTPQPLLDRLNAEFTKAVQTPKAEEFYKTYTLDFAPNSAAEFAAFVKQDAAVVAKVFKTIGIEPSEAK